MMKTCWSCKYGDDTGVLYKPCKTCIKLTMRECSNWKPRPVKSKKKV